MILYCAKCGKEIPENAKFCPYCGEEVVFNRNNPDAKEITIEDIEREKAQKAEEEVKFEEPKQESSPYYPDSVIKQYRQEIEVCRKKRKTMVTIGIIISALCLIATFVLVGFAMTRAYQIGFDAASSETPINIYDLIESDYSLNLYMTLISIFGVILDVGVLLIVLGAVVNSVKIKNREKIIEENERNKRL